METIVVEGGNVVSNVRLGSAALAVLAGLIRCVDVLPQCDLSVPMLVTSCATIRWFVVSTALCTL